MIWVEITLADVLAHLPTDVKARHDEWIANHPDKAGRLATLTANTIREFRDAIRSNPANQVDPRETYLPQSAVRHAENIIIFNLAMEMGVAIDSSGNSARTSADVFLRSIPFGRWNTKLEGEDGEGSPRFSVPERTESGRALPLVAALMLLASTACAGWIKPGSTMYDTDILTTFAPSAYTNASTTLFGHLAGINAALGSLFGTLASPDSYTNFVRTDGAVMSGMLTNTAGITTFSLTGYDQTQPTPEGGRLQPLVIKGATGRTFGPYALAGGDVVIDGGNAYSFAAKGRVILSNVHQIVFDDGTTFNSADNIPKLNAITTAVIRAAGTGTTIGVTETYEDLQIRGKDGWYAGWFNHYAGGITLKGGVNPPEIGGSKPAPVTVHNPVLVGGVASNTMADRLWFSPNSYLSGLGSTTSLFFVVLLPPSTNRIDL